MKKYVIRGGNVITTEEILEQADVLIRDGRIEAIVSNRRQSYEDYEVMDASGLYVSPGFVDIHQHGGGGSDYMDEDGEAYDHILSAHRKHGVTSVMPTLLSASSQNTIRAIRQYHRALKDDRIKCNLLGLHLEGPYISPNQAGAQKPENIRDFDPGEYEKIYDASQGMIRRWSVAPEVNGAEEFARFAQRNHIVLSIAHSDADFEMAERAFDWGFHHVTHFYSATSSVIRRGGFRVAGIVEAAYYLDGMNVEIIADGCHLPISLLKLITKIKKKDSVALITDAMRAAGQDVETSYLGSADDALPVVIEDGVAKMMDRQGFAGSIATADRLIRTMQKAQISLVDAVKMVTVNPLRMMQVGETKGELKAGFDADICLFDEDINVKSVMIGGNIVED